MLLKPDEKSVSARLLFTALSGETELDPAALGRLAARLPEMPFAGVNATLQLLERHPRLAEELKPHVQSLENHDNRFIARRAKAYLAGL